MDCLVRAGGRGRGQGVAGEAGAEIGGGERRAAGGVACLRANCQVPQADLRPGGVGQHRGHHREQAVPAPRERPRGCPAGAGAPLAAGLCRDLVQAGEPCRASTTRAQPHLSSNHFCSHGACATMAAKSAPARRSISGRASSTRIALARTAATSCALTVAMPPPVRRRRRPGAWRGLPQQRHAPRCARCPAIPRRCGSPPGSMCQSSPPGALPAGEARPRRRSAGCRPRSARAGCRRAAARPAAPGRAARPAAAALPRQLALQAGH